MFEYLNFFIEKINAKSKANSSFPSILFPLSDDYLRAAELLRLIEFGLLIEERLEKSVVRKRSNLIQTWLEIE